MRARESSSDSADDNETYGKNTKFVAAKASGITPEVSKGEVAKVILGKRRNAERDPSQDASAQGSDSDEEHSKKKSKKEKKSKKSKKDKKDKKDKKASKRAKRDENSAAA